MSKKPMTKSQIVSYFAGKFELSKKTAAEIIDEVAALAVSETKKAGPFGTLYPSWDRETCPRQKESSHGGQSSYRCGD
jgi:hypothetical protein